MWMLIKFKDEKIEKELHARKDMHAVITGQTRKDIEEWFVEKWLEDNPKIKKHVKKGNRMYRNGVFTGTEDGFNLMRSISSGGI